MTKRRLKLLLSMALSILILGYWGFYEPAYQLPKLPADQPSRQIDGFVVGAISTAYNTDGTAKQQLNSARMTRYPLANKTLVEAPDILIYRQDQRPVRILAQTGEISSHRDEIILRQQVSVTEQQPGGFSLTTEFLRLEPANDYAETDTAVTLRSGSGETNAIGMKAFLAENRLQLLENVRGLYDPR